MGVGEQGDERLILGLPGVPARRERPEGERGLEKHGQQRHRFARLKALRSLLLPARPFAHECGSRQCAQSQLEGDPLAERQLVLGIPFLDRANDLQRRLHEILEQQERHAAIAPCAQVPARFEQQDARGEERMQVRPPSREALEERVVIEDLDAKSGAQRRSALRHELPFGFGDGRGWGTRARRPANGARQGPCQPLRRRALGETGMNPAQIIEQPARRAPRGAAQRIKIDLEVANEHLRRPAQANHREQHLVVLALAEEVHCPSGTGDLGASMARRQPRQCGGEVGGHLDDPVLRQPSEEIDPVDFDAQHVDDGRIACAPTANGAKLRQQVRVVAPSPAGVDPDHRYNDARKNGPRMLRLSANRVFPTAVRVRPEPLAVLQCVRRQFLITPVKKPE